MAILSVRPSVCLGCHDPVRALLPVFAIRMIWEELGSPPATGDQMTDEKTAVLAAYFGAT